MGMKMSIYVILSLSDSPPNETEQHHCHVPQIRQHVHLGFNVSLLHLANAVAMVLTVRGSRNGIAFYHP